MLEEEVVLTDVVLPAEGHDVDIVLEGESLVPITFNVDDEGTHYAVENVAIPTMNGPGFGLNVLWSGGGRYSEYHNPRSGCGASIYLGKVEWSAKKFKDTADADAKKNYFAYEHKATAYPAKGVWWACGYGFEMAASRVYVQSKPVSSTRNKGWRRLDHEPIGSTKVSCGSSHTIGVKLGVASVSSKFSACDTISGGATSGSGAWALSANNGTENIGHARRINVLLSGSLPQQAGVPYFWDYGTVRWWVHRYGRWSWEGHIVCDTMTNAGYGCQ